MCTNIYKIENPCISNNTNTDNKKNSTFQQQKVEKLQKQKLMDRLSYRYKMKIQHTLKVNYNAKL